MAVRNENTGVLPTDLQTFQLTRNLYAALIAGTALNGFAAVAIENYGKRLYEHAGHTASTRRDYYDIALTANTIGSGAGTVSTLLNFALG